MVLSGVVWCGRFCFGSWGQVRSGSVGLVWCDTVHFGLAVKVRSGQVR